MFSSQSSAWETEVDSLCIYLKVAHLTISIKKENKMEHRRAPSNGKEKGWFSYDCFQLNIKETDCRDLIQRRLIFLT